MTSRFDTTRHSIEKNPLAAIAPLNTPNKEVMR